MIHLQLASFAICDPVQSPWILLETSLPITADLCQDTDFTERLYNSTMLAVGHSEVKWLRNRFENGKFLVKHKSTPSVRMLCGSSVFLEMSKTMTSFRDDDGFEIRVTQLMGCLIFFCLRGLIHFRCSKISAHTMDGEQGFV